MAMQYIPKKEKAGAYRIYDPKQKGYAVTHELKGSRFVFFNKSRGCIVGKGIQPTYDQYGKLVSDLTTKEIVEHFKNLGFVVEDEDKKKSTQTKESKNDSEQKSTQNKEEK